MPEVIELKPEQIPHLLEITRCDIIIAGTPPDAYAFPVAHGNTRSYVFIKYPDLMLKPIVGFEILGSRADREAAFERVKEAVMS